MDEINEERTKIEEYLLAVGGMFLEETDKAYKFMVQSQVEYDGVIGVAFLMNFNVGKPRQSSVIPTWLVGRIYKDGEPVDEKEDAKF